MYAFNAHCPVSFAITLAASPVQKAIIFKELNVSTSAPIPFTQITAQWCARTAVALVPLALGLTYVCHV